MDSMAGNFSQWIGPVRSAGLWLDRVQLEAQDQFGIQIGLASRASPSTFVKLAKGTGQN